MTTLPQLALEANVRVSASDTSPPPPSYAKLTVSSMTSAYTVSWNICVPVYGPNGGLDGVDCMPRTSVPTSASSVPVDCTTPLSVTSAVTVIELTKRVASNTNGTGGGTAGGDGVEGGVGGRAASAAP